MMLVDSPKYLFCLCGDRTKASSRVRGYWIADVLKARGIKCTLESRHSKLVLILLVWQILFHDVVVFQKVYSRYHYFLLCWANFLKKTTIIDLDDAPSRTQNPKTLQNIERIMRSASVVTVGSRALFDYASQFSDSVRLVPSSIYLKYYQPDELPSPSDLVCLGWIGNGSHYKQDLIDTLKQPLVEIATQHPIKLKLIGACGESSLYDAFKDIPSLTVDFVDQIDWANPQAVSAALSDIDIGLYPLLPNDFNQYKCGFKALEYMAMGLPVISSDVAENREIVEHGVTGLFARSPEDWVQQIEYLLDDEMARLEMGRQGREKVEQQYSVVGAAETVLHAV